jgi:hypothetical protein
MRKNIKNIAVLSFVLLFALSGCNFGAQAPTEVVVVEETPTDVPVVDVSLDSDVPEIQHVMIPGEFPASQSGSAGDQDSSVTAGENRAPGGDRFTFGRYERPFSSGEMNVYHAYIDIINTTFRQDDTWLFGTITVKDDGSGQSLDGKYGFELDLNLDGGGDVLVMVIRPSSADWTTGGVQVWYDENNDVGGSTKGSTDNSSSLGDGFETLLFDDGQGDDPDLAWARIDPQDPFTVQIAVKRSILGRSTAFMIGMWAGNDLFDPALFDLNDRLTHEQAGSSLKEFEFFYPLKEVYELDNACRLAVGFQPNGGEPGICPVPQIQRPERDPQATPKPGDPPPTPMVCPPGTYLVCPPGYPCYCEQIIY